MDLTAVDLACRRAGRLVFSGIGFTISRGEAALLSGPNGSGKSSLLRLIAGLLAPDAGDVRIGDVSLREDRGTFQEYLAYAGHLDAIKPQLTVLENLRLWAGIYGAATALPTARDEEEEDQPAGRAKSRRTMLDDKGDEALAPPADRLEQALDRMGIRQLASFPAGYCSAGQKRRLGLARLLVIDRPVWLLDEPTVSLDVDAVEIFAEIVREHLDNGGLAIAATHVPLGLSHTQEIIMGEDAPDERGWDEDGDAAPALPDDPFLEGDWR